jgi:predicted nucleic acid-binding protein
MNIVADTDVLIDFLAAREPSASRVGLELEHGSLKTTAVTRFELLAGARTARQQALVRELLDAIPAVPLDAHAAPPRCGARWNDGEPRSGWATA